MIICLPSCHSNINLIFLGCPGHILYINMGFIECALFGSCSVTRFIYCCYDYRNTDWPLNVICIDIGSNMGQYYHEHITSWRDRAVRDY